MKKHLKPICILLCVYIIFMLAGSVSAEENTYKSWNNSVTDFAPNVGTLSVTYYSTYVKTILSFRYTANDVATISDYNSLNLFTGMDIKSHTSSGAGTGDKMDAYYIVTSLPNPKTDFESNSGFSYDNEADVVALGTIVADTPYSVTVHWNDYRTGASADAGAWKSNAELSTQFFPGGDYNTSNYVVLPTIEYGSTKGQK